MESSNEIVAREILNVVPLIMRTIRSKWKNGTISGVTNSQFRILMFLHRKPGTSLQDVAHHIGLTAPTTSTTVDQLVCNHLVNREPSLEDRRKIELTLTDHGKKILEEVFTHSRNHLASYLALLSAQERDIIYQALELLASTFAIQRELEVNNGDKGVMT